MHGSPHTLLVLLASGATAQDAARIVFSASVEQQCTLQMQHGEGTSKATLHSSCDLITPTPAAPPAPSMDQSLWYADESLVAYLRLDETIGSTPCCADATRYNNAGTLRSPAGAEPTPHDGFCRGKTWAPGTYESVQIPPSDSMQVEADESFTIALWAKYADFTYPKTALGMRSGYGCYFAKDREGATNGFDIGHGFNSSVINVCYRDHNTLDGPTLHQNLLLDVDLETVIGKWTHFVFVHQRDPVAAGGAHLAVYVDGVRQSREVDLSSVRGPLYSKYAHTDSGGLVVGELYGWQTDGSLDEIRMYKRALSAADVAALHAYRPPVHVCPRPSFRAISYYPLNGDGKDASGNGRDGAVVGSPEWGSGAFVGAGKSMTISAGGAHKYIKLPGSGPSATSWLGRRDPWTFACWLKCTQCGSIYAEHGLAANTHHNTLHATLSGPYDNYPPGGGPTGVATGNLPEGILDDIASTWHHFAWVGTPSQSVVKLYVDGIFAATEEFEAPSSWESDNFASIPWHRQASDVTYFAGSIDEVYMLAEELSQGSIAYLAAGHMPTLTKT